MHIFNKNRIVFFILMGILPGTLLLGMKRTFEQPPAQDHIHGQTAYNILQLPQDVLVRIIATLYPKERNVFSKVSTWLATLAGLANKDALLAQNLDTIGTWGKRRFLIDYLSENNIAMGTAILASFPQDYFKKRINDAYNDVLILKYFQLQVKHGKEATLPLEPYVFNKEAAARLAAELRADNTNLTMAKILFNKKEDVVACVEDFWANNKTNNQNVGTIVWHFFKLLRFAVILNNTDMVKALLQTTPFKAYFNPLATVNDVISCYPNLLKSAAHLSNANIFAEIITWICSTHVPQNIYGKVLLDLNSLPIHDLTSTLIEIGKHKHLRPIIEYLYMPSTYRPGTFHPDTEMKQALLKQEWLCLETICTVANNVLRRISLEFGSLLFYTGVLHEAGELTGTSPLESLNYKPESDSESIIRINKLYELTDTKYNKGIAERLVDDQTILSNLKILKEQEPTIFEQLQKLSHRALVDQIKNIIAINLQHTSHNPLHKFIAPDPLALATFTKKVVEELQQKNFSKLDSLQEELRNPRLTPMHRCYIIEEHNARVRKIDKLNVILQALSQRAT